MAVPAKEPDALQQFQELEQALSKPPSLLCITGKERYLVNRAVELVKETVLDRRTKDFNFDLLEGKDVTPARVVAAARTLPMMAQRRLVLVRDLEDLSAEQLNGLLDYVQAPCPETCLCFLGEKLDTRTKFGTALKKVGLVVKLEPLAERSLPTFVKQEAKRLGAKLEPGAAERIAEEVGADLGQIADALQRLCNYVAEGAPVRVADVEELVATTRQHTVFELIDAVGAGDQAAALSLLSGILAAREPALRLLAMLSRHVRQLWVTRDLLGGGRPSPAEVAQAAGVPPFVAGKLMDQARRLSPGRLAGMHELVFKADRTLKTSKIDEARHMEALVLRLCGK